MKTWHVAIQGNDQWSGTKADADAKTGDNQFTVLCDRYHLNELGTGGLMGPVVLYREK